MPWQKPSMCGTDTFRLKGGLKIIFANIYPILPLSQSRLRPQWQKLMEAWNQRAIPSEQFSSTASCPQTPESHLELPRAPCMDRGPSPGPTAPALARQPTLVAVSKHDWARCRGDRNEVPSCASQGLESSSLERPGNTRCPVRAISPVIP